MHNQRVEDAIVSVSGTWGFEEAEGEMMRQAYEAFVVEVGLQGNILQRNFTKFSGLATKGTWFHNVWEFVFHLKVTIKTDPRFHVQLVRVLEDVPIMERFANLSLGKKNLCILNRVRRLKNVLFLSNLVYCDGTTIKSSMTDRMEGVSPLPFPEEKTTGKDFELWVGALRSISSSGFQLQDRLGDLINNGVTDRKWWIAEDGTKLYYEYEAYFEGVYDIYVSEFGCYPMWWNQPVPRNMIRGSPLASRWTSIEMISQDTIILHSLSDPPFQVNKTTYFWDTLRSFPNHLLWRDFWCDGDGSWIT